MSSTQQIVNPMHAYSEQRQRPAVRHRMFRVHPAIEAVGLVLAGAGIGVLAVVTVAWVLLRLTGVDDSSSTLSAMPGKAGGIALTAPSREQNPPGYRM
jgi:uncharacterized membrane protein AbrB (regulator of aidB expression)